MESSAQKGSLSFGIIGTSKIAHDFVTALKGSTRIAFDVVAVASRDTTRAQEFAASHNIAHAYGAYEDLVCDPRVEVVYVATSTVDHYSHALLALQAGKDVLCEKAFTINAKQCEDLIEAAKSSRYYKEDRKCFLMEANWMVYWPLVQKALSMIQNNELGQIRLIQADLGFNCPDSKIFDPVFGGGSLLAVGMYCVTLAQLICKRPPSEVVSQCTFGDISGKKAADKTCSALLRYDQISFDEANSSTSVSVSQEPVTAVLTGTVVANTASAATVTGTHGSIKLCGPMFVCPTRLEVTWFDGRAVQVVESAPPSASVNVPGEWYNFPNSSGLLYQAEHLFDCRTKSQSESTLWNLSNSLQLMQTLDIIRHQCGIFYPADSS